ncbi:molybdopterin molybdotransferase MoeA [bacterium]|nr:molybdopterin molybdotransferase MoeA [bacterium]
MHKARLTNLRPLDEARNLLANEVSPRAHLLLPLEHAAGLALSHDVRSDGPLPLEDVSAMDGFAIRSADLNGSPLQISCEIAAGSSGGMLKPGTAARIFTGAVVPEGADTVVPQEQALMQENGNVLLEKVPPSSHIRKSGELFTHKSVLARHGDRLTPARIALLASGGAASVPVYPRVTFAIVLTGSELVSAGESPEPGQIRDSNGPMLRALVRESGFGDAHIHRAADDPHSLLMILEQAFASADIVLTSGGVSVGDYDFVPEMIDGLDGETLLHGVSMKPGKPLLVGRVKNKWLIGLPGNPLSVLAGWRMFALPLAHSLQGFRRAFKEQPLAARSNGSVQNKGSRTLLHPCTIETDSDGVVLLNPVPWKGSHDLYMGSRADAWMRIEQGESLTPGTRARYYVFNQLNPARMAETQPEESDSIMNIV